MYANCMYVHVSIFFKQYKLLKIVLIDIAYNACIGIKEILMQRLYNGILALEDFKTYYNFTSIRNYT